MKHALLSSSPASLATVARPAYADAVAQRETRAAFFAIVATSSAIVAAFFAITAT
jgi:hypothetical protein